MIKEKEIKDFKLDGLEGNLDALKAYFEKRDALCIFNDIHNQIYTFNFNDSFHSKNIAVQVRFLNNDRILKVRIDWDDTLNQYDVDDYYKHLLSSIYLILMQGPNKYIVRFYAKYYSMFSQQIEFSFKWENDVKITSYQFDERDNYFDADILTNSPHEQILLIDMEVESLDITSARTLAYNRGKELCSYLTVLFDIGFEEIQSEQVFIVAEVNQNYDGSVNLGSTVLNTGFEDSELELFIFDNLNGVIATSESMTLVSNDFLTLSKKDDSGKELSVSQAKNNPYLEKIFKNRNIDFNNKTLNIEKGKINKDITYYSSKVKVNSCHIAFFRKLKNFELNDYNNFFKFGNACKMYNKALTVCSGEPTMTISYLISSIESLLRIESNQDYLKNINNESKKFICFVEKYASNSNEVDVSYFKYLYGNIRSGHFHSGDFKFFEYKISLNHSMDFEFINLRNDYLRAKTELRSLFINWIEKNILK